MREDLGVMISAKINLISDSTGQQGSIVGDFGVNKIPTREQVIALVDNAINTFNEALGVSDARIVTLGDYNIAEPLSMKWPPAE